MLSSIVYLDFASLGIATGWSPMLPLARCLQSSLIQTPKYRKRFDCVGPFLLDCPRQSCAWFFPLLRHGVILVQASSNARSLGDSSMAQTTTLQLMWPITAFRPDGASRFALVVVGKSEAQLERTVWSWMRTRTLHNHTSWILIVGADQSGTFDFFLRNRLVLNFTEIHVLPYTSRELSACYHFNAALQMLDKVQFDAAFFVIEGLVFQRPGWDHTYWHALKTAGFDHLVHLPSAECRQVREEGDLLQVCVLVSESPSLPPPLFTVTPRMLATVGYCDLRRVSKGFSWYRHMLKRWIAARFSPIDGLAGVQTMNPLLTFSMSIPTANPEQVAKGGVEHDDQAENTAATSQIYRGWTEVGQYSLLGYRKNSLPILHGLFQITFVTCNQKSDSSCVNLMRWLRTNAFDPTALEDTGASDFWDHYRNQAPPLAAAVAASPGRRTSDIGSVLDDRQFFQSQSCPIARLQYYRTHSHLWPKNRTVPATPQAPLLIREDVVTLSSWIGMIRRAITLELSAFLGISTAAIPHKAALSLLDSVKQELPRNWLGLLLLA
eukprot:m.456900 g.456900  ORF g.456900 m.456900 type:complete len:550 (-) comp56979_c0_seq4:422-2071(-)